MKNSFLRGLTLFTIYFCSFHIYANSGWIPAFNYYVMQPVPTVAPKITGQKDIAYQEGQLFLLSSSDFSIIDADSTSFSIDLFPGKDYEIVNGYIVPAVDFFGELLVNVKANDGVNSSDVFAASIVIVNVNDQPLSKNLSFSLSNSEKEVIYFDEIFSDPDRDASFEDFKFHLGSVDNVTNLTTAHGHFIRNLSAGRINYIYNPNPGFYGQDKVKYWISDNHGAMSSEGEIIFNVTQSSIPVVTAQTQISFMEDSYIVLQADMYNIVDYDSQHHIITPLAGSNYTLNDTSIIPRKDFYGKITVPVTVSDGVNTSSIFFTEIEVINVNDAPVALLPYTFELKYEQSVLFYLTGLFHDVDGVNQDTEFFLMVNGLACDSTCSTLHGKLMKVSNHKWASYIYVPNKGFSGADYITYSIMDSAGALSSSSRVYFNISGPPVLKILSNQVLNFDEDKAFQLSAEHFTLSGEQADYETIITTLPGTGYTVEHGFITPKKDFYGVLEVNVVATSNGVSSGVYAAKVTINNVNDAPIMLSGTKNYSGTFGNVISGISVSELFTDADLAGGAETLALYTVQWVDKNHSTNGVTSHGTLTRSGTSFTDNWSYQPSADFSGSETVLVWVTDSKGQQSSLPAQIIFTISPADGVQPATFSPAGGTYSEQQSVSLSSLTPAAEIRFSIDGSDVTSASPLYTTPLIVATSTTIKAKAFKTGMQESAQSVASFRIENAVMPVTFSPAGGTYSEQQSVSLSSLTPAAEIRFSLDGSDVTSASTLYTAPLIVNTSTTLKAKAFKAGMQESSQSSTIFTIQTSGTKVIYLHTDALGSVIGETDVDGKVIKTTDYKPFGESKDN